MALPKWAEWLRLVTGISGTGLAVLGAAMVPLDPYRWVLVGAGVSLIALSLVIPVVVGIILPIRDGWRRRKAARAKMAAQKRLDAERAAERERLIPELAAWDSFYRAADEMRGLFYEARDTKSLEKWSAFSEARDRAVALAPGLYEPARGRALELLQPFAEVDKDDLGARSVPAADLSKWMMDWHIRYYQARKAVGLPEVPQVG